MKKQIHCYVQGAVAVLAVMLLIPLSAQAASLPTYQVNAGEADVLFTGDLVFGFTGLNVSISGDEEFPPVPCGGVGFPCGYAGDTININTLLVGTIVGSGMAGGTSYPDLNFAGEVDFIGAPLVIPNRVNPVLKEAFSFNNNPFLTGCVPPFFCFVGGGTDAVFNVAFVPTGEVTIALQGPDPSGIYILDSAVYSFATPEPGSIALFGSGILGLGGLLRRKLML